MSEPKYYIWASDPHGTGRDWIDLVHQAQTKYPDSQSVFGGDYIDGNSQSAETVDFIRDQVEHHGAIALLGNHEQLLIDFVEHHNLLWYVNGAKTTVKSFFGRGFSKRKTRQLLKADDRYRFLTKLPMIYTTPHLIFVHAGIQADHQNWQDANIYHNQKSFYLWARTEYFYQAPVKNLYFMHNVTKHTIVTGHTPTMFINGEYDKTYPDGQPVLPTTNIYDIHDGKEDPTKRPCPVVKVQYPNESPRYFTDDGCHGAPNHHGNVCVFTNTGNLIEVFNSDPKDEQAYDWSTDSLK